MTLRNLDVRFTPKSGHRLSAVGCPLCANNGLMHRSNCDHRYCRNWEFSPAAGVGYCSRGLTCRSTIPGSVNVSLARRRPEPSTKMGVGLEATVIHRNSSDEDFRGKR